jgi:spermidine/putrescine transport system substrate-binding protein
MKRLALVLVVVGLAAAACGGDGAETTASTPGSTTAPKVCAAGETDGDLVLYNWTQYIPTGPEAEAAGVTDLIAKFEEEYGVRVTQDFFTSNEELRSKLQAGATGYDVVVPSDYMVSMLITDGLLMELQRDAIPNFANLDPEFIGPPFDPENRYHMPYQWGTTGIGVAYAELPADFPTSWGLIFDPELSAAYLGYSVNSTSEAEIREAGDLLKATLDRGVVATFDSDTFENLLTSGETVIAHGYSGDFFLEFNNLSTDDYDAWEDYGYFVPDEGGVLWVDTMAIPANAPHPCTAHAFINFILDAENGAELTNYNYYGSPNAAAEEFIWPEVLEDPAIYPPPEVRERLEFLADLGELNAVYERVFTEAQG